MVGVADTEAERPVGDLDLHGLPILACGEACLCRCHVVGEVGTGGAVAGPPAVAARRGLLHAVGAQQRLLRGVGIEVCGNVFRAALVLPVGDVVGPHAVVGGDAQPVLAVGQPREILIDVEVAIPHFHALRIEVHAAVVGFSPPGGIARVERRIRDERRAVDPFHVLCLSRNDRQKHQTGG